MEAHFSGLRSGGFRKRPPRSNNFKKRAPARTERKITDIYLGHNVNFKEQFKHIEKLWADGNPEVTIHSLGSSIACAINLALQLHEKHYKLYDLEVSTDSVELVDDIFPATDCDDFETHARRNSAIRIRIFRKINPETKKQATSSAVSCT